MYRLAKNIPLYFMFLFVIQNSAAVRWVIDVLEKMTEAQLFSWDSRDKYVTSKHKIYIDLYMYRKIHLAPYWAPRTRAVRKTT